MFCVLKSTSLQTPGVGHHEGGRDQGRHLGQLAVAMGAVDTHVALECPGMSLCQGCQNKYHTAFPGAPVVGTQSFHCQGPGSIPGEGTNIPRLKKIGATG